MKVINKNKNNVLYWIGAVVVLFMVCFALLYFSEAQLPTNLTTSGIVAIISAIIGVLLTVFAISIQLKQQSEHESQKEKSVKIYEKKIDIYSKFAQKLWKIVGDVNPDDVNKIYKDLKNMCFDELVFFLSQEEIEQLRKVIEEMKINKDNDNLPYICKIINILQNSLENKQENESYLQKLYEVFDGNNVVNVVAKDNPSFKRFCNNIIKTIANVLGKKELGNMGEYSDKSNDRPSDNSGEEKSLPNITFWHFNTLDEAQIKEFKNGNWFLSLIEYGEDWRTGQLQQVKPDDVVFLFMKGGTGYIGAFKVKNPPNKIIKAKNYDDYSEQEKKELDYYDIYNAIEDGATLVSCLHVQPIAYNYKGVGYWTVRRRTIERINDPEGAVRYLLNGFRGIFEGDNKADLERRYKEGNGKLDENMNIDNLDSEYFKEVCKINNLS
jgi:flagellin-specific chaperone FliS